MEEGNPKRVGRRGRGAWDGGMKQYGGGAGVEKEAGPTRVLYRACVVPRLQYGLFVARRQHHGQHQAFSTAHARLLGCSTSFWSHGGSSERKKIAQHCACVAPQLHCRFWSPCGSSEGRNKCVVLRMRESQPAVLAFVSQATSASTVTRCTMHAWLPSCSTAFWSPGGSSDRSKPRFPAYARLCSCSTGLSVPWAAAAFPYR